MAKIKELKQKAIKGSANEEIVYPKTVTDAVYYPLRSGLVGLPTLYITTTTAINGLIDDHNALSRRVDTLYTEKGDRPPLSIVPYGTTIWDAIANTTVVSNSNASDINALKTNVGVSSSTDSSTLWGNVNSLKDHDDSIDKEIGENPIGDILDIPVPTYNDIWRNIGENPNPVYPDPLNQPGRPPRYIFNSIWNNIGDRGSNGSNLWDTVGSLGTSKANKEELSDAVNYVADYYQDQTVFENPTLQEAVKCMNELLAGTDTVMGNQIIDINTSISNAINTVGEDLGLIPGTDIETLSDALHAIIEAMNQ